MKPLLSIILPSYNNGACLPATIRRIRRTCPKNTEVVIVMDGSTDETRHILSHLSARHPPLRVITHKVRMGKGAAVRDGVRAARGHMIAFIDADMAIDPLYVAQGVKWLQENPSLDAVIARRKTYHTGTARLIFHTVFHWIEFLLFRMPYHDTQAPMKVFRAPVAKAVFAKLQARSYAFDIEVLFRTMARGNGVAELTVVQRKTRSSLKWNLLLFSSIEMLRMYRTYIAHIVIRLLVKKQRRSPFVDAYSLRHVILWPFSWPLLWIAQFLYHFVQQPMTIHKTRLPDYPSTKPVLMLRQRTS